MTQTEEPLLYVPGATEGTTQWRVEEFQLVRWGGFEKEKFAISEDTTLLTGASGTGKSTILDAYVAVMMPSGTRFNGASNDTAKGRARSDDQRSLASYLRGELDSDQDTDTGEEQSVTLRGRDEDTWGAVAVTFKNDRGQRYTLARLYYVPRAATRDSELVRKMCTIEGSIDLPQVEPLAPSKFDKRAVEARFPNLKMHRTYSEFAQVFCTRLGIGANADGASALDLLTLIQAGQEIPSVDDLYKRLVLDEPETFALADKAVDHFRDLEASYNAMDTEHRKAEVLKAIPAHHSAYEYAVAQARLFDTFGIQDEGETTPFTLWSLNTEDRLLGAAEDTNREARTVAEAGLKEAEEHEATIERLLDEAQTDLNNNERHAAARRINDDLDRLGQDLDEASAKRTRFETNIASLGVQIQDKDDFEAAQASSRAALDDFESESAALDAARDKARDEQAPYVREKGDLRSEQGYLRKHKGGRMDWRLAELRDRAAEAAGLPSSAMPFVGELINIPDEEKRWQDAIEIALHGVARLVLVDDRYLDEVSERIDALPFNRRLNIEGVTLDEYHDVPLDSRYISGKLEYKDTAFTNWVRDRITRPNTDALCVDDPRDLPGPERRITLSGQTRHKRSLAHGKFNGDDSNVIGFSSEDRLAEIETRLADLEVELARHDARRQAIENQRRTLTTAKAAHEYLLNTTWLSIDVDGLETRIDHLARELDALHEQDPSLDALETKVSDLKRDYKKAVGSADALRRQVSDLRSEHERLINHKDRVTRRIEQINAAQQVVLSDEQQTQLDKEYDAVTDGEDPGIDEFPMTAKRLKRRLAVELLKFNEAVTAQAGALEQIFRRYLDNWEEEKVNLRASVEDYPSFRRILDNIHATGLADRRAEWRRRVVGWTGQDLVPLRGAHARAVHVIQQRLEPINHILAGLEFGAGGNRIEIALRTIRSKDVDRFTRELTNLASQDITDYTDDQVKAWFKRLQKFMAVIRADDPNKKNRYRAQFLDVRRQIEVTAPVFDQDGKKVATYSSLGKKSGGETQELIAFILGAALRFKLGDDESKRPRFAPVFIDEAFIKADGAHAGRGVSAWKKVGFQLIIGAPPDKVTSLEPHVDLLLQAVKAPMKKHSRVVSVTPDGPVSLHLVDDESRKESTG